MPRTKRNSRDWIGVGLAVGAFLGFLVFVLSSAIATTQDYPNCIPRSDEFCQSSDALMMWGGIGVIVGATCLIIGAKRR